MIGILTEKPSAAKNFSVALGGMFGTYNGERYTIVASHGHLYGFNDDPGMQVKPELKDKYSDWGIHNLPWNESDLLWKYEKKDPKDQTPKNIKEVLSACDEICIATDDDPTGEGELLAWEILDQQKIHSKKYTRMYFTDEAPVSIQKAFRERVTLGTSLSCMYDDPDYRQAIFRTKWDYMSMQWTRVATKINNRYGETLRNGRLKSAMIVIVGDQLKAIDEYVKKPFFQNRFKDENGIVYTNKDEPTFEKKEAVPNIYKKSDVVPDSKTMKKSAPPKFLDLASLSARLAEKGISADTTLKTYQNMYEAQIVSYPRTEDKVITEEQFKQLLPLIDKIAAVVNVDPSILTHRTPRKGFVVKSDAAHGANRPGLVVPSSLDDLERFGRGAKEIYSILARNYLATLAEDYEYEQQKGHVKDYPKFIGTANVPKKPGWKAVFGDDEKDEDESAKGLGKIASPFIYEGANPKPQAPTMKWLMKQLEKRNVGTGATRTSTYSDVTNAKTKHPLLVDKRGKITMAPCGESNYRLLPGTHIGDLTMTEHVMEEMKDVAAGKRTAEECLHEIQAMILEDIETMKKNAASSPGKPKAEVKEKYEGIWNGQPVKFSRKWSDHEFTDEECEALCRGETIAFKSVSKFGNPYDVKGSLAEQTYNKVKFVGFKPDFEEKPKATKTNVPDSWGGHVFTNEEKDLLKNGKSVSADDFFSERTKKNYSTTVRYGKVNGYYKVVPEFSSDYKKLEKAAGKK